VINDRLRHEGPYTHFLLLPQPRLAARRD